MYEYIDCSMLQYHKAFPFGEGGFFIAPQGDEKDGRGVTAVRIRRKVTVKWYAVPHLSRPLRGHPPQRGGLFDSQK